MSTDINNLNAFSPAAMWRDWVVKSEAQWSETLSQMLTDERGGKVLKKQVDEADRKSTRLNSSHG